MCKLEGSSTPAATRSPSPDWDIDANGSLPLETSDEGSDDYLFKYHTSGHSFHSLSFIYFSL